MAESRRAASGPEYYIADEPLFTGGTAGLPVRAFSPGHRVPAAHVTKFGWQAKVHAPQAPAPATPAAAGKEG